MKEKTHFDESALLGFKDSISDRCHEDLKSEGVMQ